MGVLVGLGSCGGETDQDSRITAMDFNMYVGFGIGFLSEYDLTDPEERAAAFSQVLDEFQQTEFVTRIRGMAKVIAAEEPDVIGLQEVMSIVLTRGTDDPSDDQPLAEFLDFLLDAIELEGGPRYRAFSHVLNEIGGEFDLLGGLQDFVFREGNAILVHPDWKVEATKETLYDALFLVGTLPGPAGPVDFYYGRGAQFVRISRGGVTAGLFNTHIEAQTPPDSQLKRDQTSELVQFIQEQSGVGDTLFLFADMNSTPGSKVDGLVRGAGFLDAFVQAGQGDGLTCCQADDLSNSANQATERIDYVYVRPGASPSVPAVIGTRLVMDKRVPRANGSGEIWLSDHFGVLADLEFP